MRVKTKSNMNDEFNQAFVDWANHCPTFWLTWIGQPMLYDGALFVTRQ